MSKKCNRCLKERVLTDFHKCKEYSDGLQPVCKICRIEQAKERYAKKKHDIIAYTYKYRSEHREEWIKYSAEYRKRNKEIARIKKILKTYNLTVEEYERIFSNQNHKCAICGKKDFAPKIDHDHATGKVRGILCFTCNCALGAFNDNISLLKSAIFYLNANNTVTDTEF